MSSNNIEELGKAIFGFLTCIQQPESVLKDLEISRAPFYNLKSGQMPERKSTCLKIFKDILGMRMPDLNNENEVAFCIKQVKNATQRKKEIYEKLRKKTVYDSKFIKTYKFSEIQYENFLTSRLSDYSYKISLIMRSYYDIDKENPDYKTLYFYFPQWICDILKYDLPIVFETKIDCDIEDFSMDDNDETSIVIDVLQDNTEASPFRDKLIDLIIWNTDIYWGNFERMEFDPITLEEMIDDAEEVKWNEQAPKGENYIKRNYSILCDILDTLEIEGKINNAEEAKENYVISKEIMTNNGFKDLFDIIFKQMC